jgi:hypothetical protein
MISPRQNKVTIGELEKLKWMDACTPTISSVRLHGLNNWKKPKEKPKKIQRSRKGVHPRMDRVRNIIPYSDLAFTA